MAKFEEHAKQAINTGIEVLTVGAAGVAAHHFLHAEKLLAGKEKEMYYQYFGGIKFVGFCLLSTMFDNHYAKLACIGGALQGGIEQANASLFPKKLTIGATEQEELTKKLEELAKTYQSNSGGGAAHMGSQQGGQYSQVGNSNAYSAVGGGWGQQGWNYAA